MDKLGRKYTCYIQKTFSQSNDPFTFPDESFLKFELPISIDFNINRNNLGDANYASIRLYNLAEENRSQITKALYTNNKKRIMLIAGYSNTLSIIFNGMATEAFSVREGVDFITQIESFDDGSGFINSKTNRTFKAGTPFRTVLQEIAGDLENVAPGFIGDYPGTLQRGSTYSGSTIAILRELSGGGFSVDNGAYNILGNNEYIENALIEISSDTGLLGTPKLESGQFIAIDMIFEPRIIVNQSVYLNSSTASNYNGLYKVTGVQHKGMISEAVCGSAITSLTLMNFTNNLTPVTSRN